MKKVAIVAIILVTITLGIILIANFKQEVGTSAVKTVTPIKPFGNQTLENASIGEGDWLYMAKWHSEIVKHRLAINSESETIFSTTGDSMPSNVSAYGGWIYFTIEDMVEGGDVDLYRIREDGSGKRKLLNGGDDSGNYVLAKEGIVYLNSGSIYIMNLDGTDKRKIPIGNDEEGMASNLGIDNDWIYFLGAEGIYRMKPDGTKIEKIYSSDIYIYVMDNNELYFVQSTEKMEKKYLYRKTINGEKTLLVTGSFSKFGFINIEGDWLYYEDSNKVYKMKKTGEGEKELVYEGKKNEEVNSILLYDGDVLISTTSKDVYIKKDGEVIDLD